MTPPAMVAGQAAAAAAAAPRAVGTALAGCGLPLPEARALLARVLEVPRERLIARPEAPLPAAAEADFAALVARRRSGEPLAYLLGEQEFYGRAFRVSPEVLIPRPDTETLIEAALEVMAERSAPRILDLGTGSGCIAVTLKLERPDAQVVATDRSPGALDMAARNAAALGAEVTFCRGDWFAAVGDDRFDLMVSNPPYIAQGDPHLAELRHEPLQALTDGRDGLRHLEHLIAGAGSFLHPDGWIVLEHGFDQSDAVMQRLAAAGLRSLGFRHDLAGRRRVALGQR